MSDKPIVYKKFGTLLRSVPEVNRDANKFYSSSPQLDYKLVLPKNFDGRVVWKDQLSKIQDQGQCGGCYSYAVIGALSDRFNILSGGQMNVQLSAAKMVLCLVENPRTAVELIFLKKNVKEFEEQVIKAYQENACQGNTLFNAALFTFLEGSPKDECLPNSIIEDDIQGTDYCTTVTGPELDRCLNANFVQRQFRSKAVYTVGGITAKITERNIMYEIYKFGPVATGFTVFDDFLNWEPKDDDDIYTHPDKNSASQGGHAVKIVGWGTKGDIDYWIIANSWSENWGSKGYFKMQRNIPECELEKNVVSVLPDLPNITLKYLNILNSFATEDDIKVRLFNKVHPVTFYSSSAIVKMNQGLAKNDNVPFYNPRKLPDILHFVAGRGISKRREFFFFLLITLLLINILILFFLIKRK